MKTPDLDPGRTDLPILPCLTRVEFAAVLHVSLRTADRIIAAKEIRVRRIRGKAVRILRSDVERYLNGD
jgi:excisionase family DNA binding protein